MKPSLGQGVTGGGERGVLGGAGLGSLGPAARGRLASVPRDCLAEARVGARSPYTGSKLGGAQTSTPRVASARRRTGHGAGNDNDRWAVGPCEPPMRIASFSDTHLGPAPERDRFRHCESTLLRFSEHVQSSHDRAVLVGDVFQTDWGRSVGSHPAEVDAILARYARLWACWSTPFYVLVRGNHDRATQKHLGACEQFEANADGVKVLYLHGDTYDVTLRGVAPDVTMWIVGRLRQWGMARASDWIEDRLLQPLNDVCNLGDPVKRASPRIGAAGGGHVIVAGHTHRAACQRIGGVVYANSGATTPESLTYVSIDTGRRTVTLRRYDDAGRTSHGLAETRIP
jgi:predicted phosphodiesterase